MQMLVCRKYIYHLSHNCEDRFKLPSSDWLEFHSNSDTILSSKCPNQTKNCQNAKIFKVDFN